MAVTPDVQLKGDKMTTAKYTIPVKNVEKSFNIKQGIDVYFSRLNKILPRIINGCDDFNNCPICQCDYSVQFLDIAVCILYEDGLISKRIKSNIMSKLYDGHRG